MWARFIRNRTEKEREREGDISVCCNPKLGHTGTDGIILKRILHKYGCGLDLYEVGQRQTFLCAVMRNQVAYISVNVLNS